MFTIYDYVNYYKNTSLKMAEWNIIDNLMCATLAYTKLTSFTGTIGIKDLYYNAKVIAGKPYNNPVAVYAYELLEKVADSPRYKDLKISNYIDIKTNDTQFGAMTFRINNITVVSYKGTDGSCIGWLENFRLASDYPTYTQKMAASYLNKNVHFNDKKVYIVGHSKGGNLAMSAVMEASRKNYHRIVQVCNFDGPGFKYSEYNSEKYQLMKQKLVNIIPTGSIVGVLMNNDDYQVVKSKNIAIDEHHPTSWGVFGQFFIKGELSTVSKQLHESSTTGFNELDPKIVRETIDALFQILGKEHTDDFRIKFSDILKIYQNMKNIDPKIKKYADQIITSMTGVSYKK